MWNQGYRGLTIVQERPKILISGAGTGTNTSHTLRGDCTWSQER